VSELAVAASVVVVVLQEVGSMQCPKCESSTLVAGKIKSDALEVDRCSQCKGVWFDKDELAKLLGKRAKKNVSIPDSAVLSPFVKCPRCEASLYECCYPGTTTLVDYCRQCYGYWLDNKEWIAISRARSKCEEPESEKENDTPEKTPPVRKEPVVNNFVKSRAPITPTVSEKSKDTSQSFAAGIPGLKGFLLEKIEAKIEELSSYNRWD